jgi:hypothetical protein
MGEKTRPISFNCDVHDWLDRFQGNARGFLAHQWGGSPPGPGASMNVFFSNYPRRVLTARYGSSALSNKWGMCMWRSTPVSVVKR